MDKSLRIKANILQDKIIHVNLTQDIKSLEILSLNLTQQNRYTVHESSYGVIVGRVLANDAFGIPNVKVSVFVKLADEDSNDSEVTNLYPYTSVQSFDSEYRKYNLLPDESEDDCYRIVGTFPNKRLVLDNDTVLDVYDKYWKYTTVTNNAGDYVLFGVPTGNQQLHVDLDLSDIGVLSQKPRDMLYKGYNIEQFDSPTQFKEGTNLNNLSQIVSQNQSVDVYPFWGDEQLGEIGITRCDISVDYKFETTCVFMGSLVTNNVNDSITHTCAPSKYCGFNRNLTAGEGTIEMIRKTIDGLLEDYQIKGNRLIDSDGVWCYQIPMNLDYVQTDEYGNIIPTDNPNKGIPTRTRVRFRISLAEGSVEGASKHRAKYLVPNNPELDDNYVEPYLDKAGTVYENYYEFGSATPENCYRNLYWNKVYTVKSFIPRLQTVNKTGTQNYSGIRTTNLSNNLNPVPFNKLRFKIFFSYRILCLLLTFIVYIVTLINYAINAIDGIANISIFGFKPFKFLCVGCIAFEGGLTDDADSNSVYYPGCNKNGLSCSKCPKSIPKCTKNGSTSDLIDVIQQNLAQEYDTVNLDFYNDWLNGCLYYPLWYWKKTKKKKYLFGLFTKKAVNTFCNCKNTYPKLLNGYLGAIKRVFQFGTKDIQFISDKYQNFNKTDGGIDKWDTNYHDYKNAVYGLIKEKPNAAGLNVYYYTCGNVLDTRYKVKTDVSMPFMRLFATDLVLLGSFNDCDIDGIPKFFRTLPSTTANIPFFRKVTQTLTDDDTTESEEGGPTDYGTLLISGMDWLHDGKKQTPKYSPGLLMDLSCTGIDSLLKTDVNIERMSELGVGLDMSYSIPYSKDDKTLYQTVSYPDGLITRYEINDNESRYMFAVLNHLGLENLVKDQTTNYDVYKLGAIYPMDFDGMLTTAYEYTKTSTQPAYDNFDANYVEFRLGTHPHAYMTENVITYYPLYNNSYYFYFGLNDGNTAIDKFNAQYDGSCFKTSKYPFRISYSTLPAAWCQHTGHTDTDYASIDVTLEDISIPFSYTLKNSQETVLFSETNLEDTHLRFGYDSEETLNGFSAFTSGRAIEISTYTDDDGNTIPNAMINDTYYLTVTDAKAKTLTQAINIEPISIQANIEKIDLGTKYYGYNITHIEDICNEDENYGEITIKTIFIDGFEFEFDPTNFTYLHKEEFSDDLTRVGYKAVLTAVNPDEAKHVNETVFIYFTVQALTADTENKSELDNEDIAKSPYNDYNTPFYDATDTASTEGKFNLWLDNNRIPSNGTEFQRSRHNCGCQNEFFKENDATYETQNHLASPSISSITWVEGQSEETVGEEHKVVQYLRFNVWIPTYYTVTINQYCDGVLNDNIYNETIEIKNGKPFIATLDTMPILFMMSGGTDYYNTQDGTRKVSGVTTYVNGEWKLDFPDYKADSGKYEHYFFYDSSLIKNNYSVKTGGGVKQPYYLSSWFELNKFNMATRGNDRNLSKYNTDVKKIGHDDDLGDCLYYFPDYYQKEKLEIYGDYIDTIETDSETGKINADGVITIAENIFNWVFALAKETYIVDDGTPMHTFACSGGKKPLLIRSVYPSYDLLADGQKQSLSNKWYVDSLASVSANIDYPDIVGFNYSGASANYYTNGISVYNERLSQHYTDVNGTSSVYTYADEPSAFFNFCVDSNIFNDDTNNIQYKSTSLYPTFYLSNYFAAFSHNGGFVEQGQKTGKYEWDSEKGYKGVDRMPYSTSVLTGFQPSVIDKSISMDEYKDEVLGNDEYKSYFPAPFIDRRFDYDLMIFTMPDTSLKIQGTSNDSGVAIITRSMHISGFTFNGIEMSRDTETDNIIGKSEDNLEYVYSGEEVKVGEETQTHYSYAYNKNNNVIPKFYSTTFNDISIVNDFYSQFQTSIDNASAYTSLKAIPTKKNIDVLPNTLAIANNANGIFGARNYPTIRGLHLLVPSSTYVEFDNISCSYDITVNTTTDPDTQDVILEGITKEGEEVSFELSLSDMISVTNYSISDAASLSNCNILYSKIISKSSVAKESSGLDMNTTKWQTRANYCRLTYKVNEDSLNTTHETVTSILNLIQSTDAKVYEYLNDFISNPDGTYNIQSFTGVTYENEVVDIPNIPLMGKCGSRLLDNGCYVLTKNDIPVSDDTDEAKKMYYSLNNQNTIEMINTNNGVIGYDNTYMKSLDTSKEFPYLAIGGVRRYINLSDHLTKSIRLINVPKMYDTHDIDIYYVPNVFTGNTSASQTAQGKVDVPDGTDEEGNPKTDEKNVESTVEGVYTKTIQYIDLSTFTASSYNTVSKIVTSTMAKIKDITDGKVYNSSRVEQSISGNYLKLEIYYYDLKPNDAKYVWQEIYLQMYNNLIYCITYPKPEVGLTTSVDGPFVGIVGENNDNGK